jgi:hypothetical protein
LPFPYSTDCYDYISEKKSVISYKSKEDCIVKHLEREEFKVCGCNKRWNYRAFGNKNSSNICPKSFECKFNAKSKIKSLEKICKNDCLIEYYMNILVDQKFTTGNPMRNTKLVSINVSLKFETLFTYLPKMNLVDYFCSVGGLISMWFGISLYDLVVIFAKELHKKIILFFGEMNYQIVILAIIKFNAFVTSKLKKISSTFTIIFFSILMLIQMIAIIKSYFDYEIVTRFEVQEIKLIPNIELTFLETTKNLNKLIEIYPELKQEIHEFEKSGINVLHMNLAQDLQFRPIYWKYLLRLIVDNRLNDFHRILETNKLIKSCQIKIDNELELINCTQGDFGISKTSRINISPIKYLNFSRLMNKKKIEKVTFVLNNFMIYQSVRLFLCITAVGPNFQTSIDSNKKTTISFSSFSVNKLRFDENDCIPKEIEKDFVEEYFEFCLFDCLIDLYNQSFGCISNSFPHYYFNRHLLKFNYKLCNTFTDKINDSLAEPFLKFCNKYCKPKCNVVNFDAKVDVSKHFWNDTNLEVIPKKSPHIAYIETLKTDINRLIYNCGGVIGLWFGISPITAVDLFSYIPEICRILINECTKIPQYLIAFLVRIKQNIISRVTLLVIKFCSLCIAYFVTSMTGFIRSIHNCGGILGLWF